MKVNTVHTPNRQWSRWLAVFVCLAAGLLATVVGTSTAQPATHFEVDLDWPRLPFGEQWITGGLGGMCVGQRGHVFLLNRQNVVPADLDGARLAPPVIELDPSGAVVRGWGEPAQLGGRLHDCHAGPDGTLWIVAAGTGVVQQWTLDGSRLLRQIGETGRFDSSDGTRDGRPLNSDRAQFFLPAAIDIHEESGETFVADGELPGGNQRIAVLDGDGRFLRQWALHREADDDTAALPHCLRVSTDGLVYVCDRQADRIQVFDRMGTFIRNIDVPWTPLTPPHAERIGTRGSAVALAFSPDTDQRLLYVLNQNSVMVDVVDRRSGEVVSSFGGGPGRYPTQFTLPHGIGVDSQGNVYVAEQEGRRIQRFTPISPR